MSIEVKPNTETDHELFDREHIEELRERVNLRMNSESLLAQSKALSYLLINVAELPNQLRHEEVGWIGGLMEDQLIRLELALAQEKQRDHHASLGNGLAEVSHG